jgi:hypothetical protein
VEASIVTTSEVCPTSSEKSSGNDWVTAIARFVRRTGANPRADASIEYVAGGREPKVYTPASFVRVSTLAPVCSLMRERLALGIAAPVGSVTVPIRELVPVCPLDEMDTTAARAKRGNDFTTLLLVVRMFEFLGAAGVGCVWINGSNNN